MNADELHRRSTVIDGHCDTLLLLADDKYDLAERHEEHHLDLPRMKEGGVTAQIFAVFIRPQYLPGQATRQALQVIDGLYQAAAANPDELCVATRADDITEAKAQGQVAAIIGLEGAEALEGDLGVLRMMYKIGVRNIGLTWNFRNQAADGLGEVRTGGGLTNFGVSLVEEMTRLGMTVDIAHLAPAGVRDVFEVSQAPIIASHANARAVCDHPRNLDDAQLEQLARNGGVIGVIFVPSFVDADPAKATLSRLLDHIDHIVKVAGEDHVGLGSDFDGFGGPPPEGLEDGSKFPNITAGLRERGYSDSAIEKILGGNYLRVFREVMG